MRRFASLIVLPALLFFALATIAPSASSASLVKLPSVKGGFNQVPTITFPKSSPPSTFQAVYLHRGTGKKVVAGQLLVANYVGQIWGGKVFDSSFSRDQLSGFPIGVGQVIPGWDKGLVGVPLGSRMLLVLPPSEGYGPSGNTGAGITGTDTLVFVIDLVAAYGATAGGDPHATVERTSVNGVTISGKTNKAPTVKIAKGSVQPKAVNTYLIAKGHGATISAGLVVLQLVEVDWSGTVEASTWQLKTPYPANIGVKNEPSVFDKLVGMKVGSRVLVELPKVSTGGPYAVVTDIVAEPHDGAPR